MSRKQGRRYSENYVQKHGTKSGYDYHKRGPNPDDPCDECRDALKAYWKILNRFDSRRGGKRAEEYGAVYRPYKKSDVTDKYGTNCNQCGEPIDMDAPRKVGIEGWEKGLHIDHVIPLSKGGDDTIENVRPTHGYCNIVKSATMPKWIEFDKKDFKGSNNMEDELENDWQPEVESTDWQPEAEIEPEVIAEPEIVKEVIPVIEPCWHKNLEKWQCNLCNSIHDKCPDCGWNTWHKE